MAIKVYRYRFYPSKEQEKKFFEQFSTCKTVYNDLLELSINIYTLSGKCLKKFDFDKTLSGKHPHVHSQVIQNVSDRVHKAFSNFFRRVKDPTYREKGFPRFKSRVRSITYPQSGFKFTDNGRLYLSKIGNLSIVKHRNLTGNIKTLTLKRNLANQWFACFTCDVEFVKEVHHSNKGIGVDVGLEHFVTLSDGDQIKNPRYLVYSENKLKLLQRRLSRKKKGSNNRKKARLKLARQHLNVFNQRTDFLHKLSCQLTERYSLIAVEDLNVRNMVKHPFLSKSIHDASWNSFIQMLSYKAVAGGGQLVKVNPRGTSKTCSNCGSITEMPLYKRQFECLKCGLICHRDINSSIEILNRALDDTVGRTGILTPVDRFTTTPKQLVASGLVEAGTICQDTNYT